MDKNDLIIGESEAVINNRIQELQEVLDRGWNRPHHRQKYINGQPVSDKEYYDYQEEQRLENAKIEAEIAFYKKCTSTGEEWEVDSDGEYTPSWLYDRI